MKPLNRLTLYALIFAVVYAALLPQARAGGCRQFVRHHYHAQKVVAFVQPIYHTVSPSLVAKAETELQIKAAVDARVDARLAELGVQSLQQPATQAPNLLAQRCASCHVTGGKSFDIATELTYERKDKFQKMLLFNQNVPADMVDVLAKIKADGIGLEMVDAIVLAPVGEGVLE